MCLLRPGQQNSQCGHDECKNFYLLKNKTCLYDSQNKTQPSSHLSKISAKLAQMDSLSPSQSTMQGSKTSPSNLKRTPTPKSETSTDGETESLTGTKKVKYDGKGPNAETVVLTPPGTNTPNLNRNVSTGFFNQPTNLQAILPESSYANLFNHSSILAQLPQVRQPSLPQNIESLLPNLSMGMNPLALQNLLQAESLRPEIIMQTQVPVRNTKSTGSSFDAILEFQSRTLGFLESQNKMLIDLGEKNELIQDTLACLIGEITSLKKIVLSNNNNNTRNSERAAPVELKMSSIQAPINNSGEPINSDDLISYLYDNQPDFEYSLVLEAEFPLPLYRERNFGFTIRLVDKNGNTVENSNRLPVSISLYTCENPPKYIDSNTAGNKILKGFAEKDLSQGAVSFDKIQIKEVTSHFRNGWIFIVVHPKLQASPQSNVFLERNGIFVDPKKIRPLVVEKVIVKAKKTKEKDQEGEQKTTDAL